MSAPPRLASEEFAVLCQVIAAVARSGGLPEQEAEDFRQHAHLRLMERGYARVKAFGGRSSLRTYLTVVVQRLLLDWRNHRFGKWRPCARAKRMGTTAVALDRLMSRDGHPLDEAVGMIKAAFARADSAPLRAVASQLPRRVRAQAIQVEALEDLGGAQFDDPVEAEQAARDQHGALRRLDRACRRLPPEDRHLLTLRFHKGLTVPEIASLLGQDHKALYRRLSRILVVLRQTLAAGALLTTNEGAH